MSFARWPIRSALILCFFILEAFAGEALAFPRDDEPDPTAAIIRADGDKIRFAALLEDASLIRLRQTATHCAAVVAVTYARATQESAATIAAAAFDKCEQEWTTYSQRAAVVAPKYALAFSPDSFQTLQQQALMATLTARIIDHRTKRATGAIR